jgi:hypothetical protein
MVLSESADLDCDELDVEGVLERCFRGCPVNARVDVTIAAHRIAWARYEADRMESSHRFAMHTIRAIVMAYTPTAQETGEQYEYLCSLPIQAWQELATWPPERVRDETLAGISRGLKMFAN